MRNSTFVESSLRPTFPFNILHFPRCLFWYRKKGCSSTLVHPFFGAKWHAKCVLAADVGQIVNSLWHLAAGLSSGDVWGGGELPQKKQKTSEFETHLFRLLTVNFRHGMGYYTWILRVLLGIFVVSVSYVAKRTSLQQKGIHSWWVYQPTVLGCFPSPIRNQQLQQNGHVQPLSWVMCKLR